MRHRRDACIGIAVSLIWSTGMASMRRCQKLPICQIEPVPAGSKEDPSLAKARPISDGGSASGRIDFRGQKACSNSNCTRAVIPLQPVGKTLVSQAVPLQPMEIHDGTENHL